MSTERGRRHEYVDTGAIIESYDERTGKYTYRKA